MTIVASSPVTVGGADAAAGALTGVALPVTGASGIVALFGAALIAFGVALQGLRRLGAGLRH